MAAPATQARQAHRPDYGVFLLMTGLILFGLLMILSAGSVQSFKLKGNGHYYFLQQLSALGVGTVGYFIAARVHYSTWRRLAVPLMVLALILLVAVFIPGVGFNYGGASRWIDLHFTLLQSSEVAKLALVIYLAAWFDRLGNKVDDFRAGFLPFVGIVTVLGFLIMLQPDTGTMSVLLVIAVAMYFVAGASLRHIAIAAGGAFGVLGVLIAIAPYRINRLLTFLDPAKDTLGTGYHVQQALVAIGSGGLFGLGFNNSVQKHFYLPEPMNDSIFAIIAEELGFFLAAAVIVAFAYFALRGFRLARLAPDTFSRLIVTGVVTWIAWQALLNIAAMLSLVPLTGVPLPFISLGGSALVVLMTAMGIVHNISRYTLKHGAQNESTDRRRRHGRARRAGARRVRTA